MASSKALGEALLPARGRGGEEEETEDGGPMLALAMEAGAVKGRRDSDEGDSDSGGGGGGGGSGGASDEETSARPPESVTTMSVFCPLLRLLCLLPDSTCTKTKRSPTSWLHLGLVFVLVAWSLFGWLIHAGFALAGKTMPKIPGWLEIADSEARSAPSGIVLTAMAVLTWFLLRNYFRGHPRHLHEVADLANGEDGNVPIARRYFRYIVTWGVLAALMGRTANLLTDLSREDGSHGSLFTQPWYSLAFDYAVTLASYFVQYSVTAFFWLYVSAICYIHSRHVRKYRLWLAANDWTPEELDRRYRSVILPLQRTCDYLSGPISYLVALLAMGGSLCALDLALSHGSENSKVFAVRFIYVVAFSIPVCAGLWNAATLSMCCDSVFKVGHQLPYRDVATKSFVTSYFLSAAAVGGGFVIFGTVLRRFHLVRGLYALCIFAASLAQIRSTHST